MLIISNFEILTLCSMLHALWLLHSDSSLLSQCFIQFEIRNSQCEITKVLSAYCLVPSFIRWSAPCAMRYATSDHRPVTNSVRLLGGPIW